MDWNENDFKVRGTKKTCGSRSTSRSCQKRVFFYSRNVHAGCRLRQIHLTFNYEKNCSPPNFFFSTWEKFAPPHTSPNLVHNLLNDRSWTPVLYIVFLDHCCLLVWCKLNHQSTISLCKSTTPHTSFAMGMLLTNLCSI